MINGESTFDQINHSLFKENSSEMLSYRSPKRKSVIERARSIFGDTFHKRPADLMKFHMKKYIKNTNSVFGNYTQQMAEQNNISGEESVKSINSNERNILPDNLRMPFS